MAKIIYTYKITNIKNGMFYYGRHVSEDGKPDNYMGKGVLIKQAIKDFGVESFKKEIIEYHKSISEAIKAEGLLVTSDVINNPLCYNIVPGGIGTKIWNEDMKSRVRLARIKNGNSISHNKNISAALKGRIVEQRLIDALAKRKEKKIIQFDKQMNLLNEWDSTQHAAFGLKIIRTSIQNNLCGRSKTAGGFIFKFKYVA